MVRTIHENCLSKAILFNVKSNNKREKSKCRDAEGEFDEEKEEERI